jgi:hypothetical protein
MPHLPPLRVAVAILILALAAAAALWAAVRARRASRRQPRGIHVDLIGRPDAKGPPPIP